MSSTGYNGFRGDFVYNPIDRPRAMAAVRELLLAIGEDPDREGLAETPARVADMYAEIFQGLTRDPNEDVKLFTEQRHEELIAVLDIPLYSMCEHHLLPFFGQAHVVYLPREGQVFGLSKIARIVDDFARRPQLQERLTSQIADFLVEAANPLGVCVVVEAEHLCMTMRGVRKPGSRTVTSAIRGIFRSDARSRAEAMAIINRR